MRSGSPPVQNASARTSAKSAAMFACGYRTGFSFIGQTLHARADFNTRGGMLGHRGARSLAAPPAPCDSEAPARLGTSRAAANRALRLRHAEPSLLVALHARCRRHGPRGISYTRGETWRHREDRAPVGRIVPPCVLCCLWGAASAVAVLVVVAAPPPIVRAQAAP